MVTHRICSMMIREMCRLLIISWKLYLMVSHDFHVVPIVPQLVQLENKGKAWALFRGLLLRSWSIPISGSLHSNNSRNTFPEEGPEHPQVVFLSRQQFILLYWARRELNLLGSRSSSVTILILGRMQQIARNKSPRYLIFLGSNE